MAVSPWDASRLMKRVANDASCRSACRDAARIGEFVIDSRARCINRPPCTDVKKPDAASRDPRRSAARS
jgi:hypothetical protein